MMLESLKGRCKESKLYLSLSLSLLKTVGCSGSMLHREFFCPSCMSRQSFVPHSMVYFQVRCPFLKGMLPPLQLIRSLHKLEVENMRLRHCFEIHNIIR
jgi:hypothetical protein